MRDQVVSLRLQFRVCDGLQCLVVSLWRRPEVVGQPAKVPVRTVAPAASRGATEAAFASYMSPQWGCHSQSLAKRCFECIPARSALRDEHCVPAALVGARAVRAGTKKTSVSLWESG